MTPKELKVRTKRFAVKVILFVRELPTTIDGKEVGRQLLRAGTSVAGNYRAACRDRDLHCLTKNREAEPMTQSFNKSEICNLRSEIDDAIV